MADDLIKVEVRMDKLGHEIDKFPDELGTALDKSLEQLGGDMVTAARAEMRKPGPPGSSKSRTGSHNSRAQAAAGISVSVRDGKLSITSDSSKMASGHKGFPAFWGSGSWRHPVFGHSRVVVVQRGGHPLGPVVKSFDPRAERDITAAGQVALDTIKGER